MRLLILLALVLPAFSTDFTNQACTIKLPSDPKSDILVNNLKFKEPKHVPTGNTITFECENGFLNEDLKDKSANFVCSRGSYNGTYQYPDLLCKSDFHKSTRVQKLRWDQLKSTVFECNKSGWGVYEVSRETSTGEKPLYRVCLDLDTMRPKFAYRLPSPEKIEIKHNNREDVWGFDGYGKTNDERMKLSQGYVKRNQQRSTTNYYSDKYNQGKTYPHYFNRGHLVAFTDFSEPADSKTTVLYLNAAPQWELLNKHSWSLVEREVRNMMKNNPEEWEIYTGTYGRIQTPKGELFLVKFFNENHKFVKAQLPVPMVFWKFAHNLVDKKKSRAFVGVNNPEFRTVQDVSPAYRLCSPVSGVKGDENHGFTYECPVTEFLNVIKSEGIVLKNLNY